MDEAEEMVQGAFIAVWERHDTLEVHTSIKSYLYRAVHNSCLNRVKHLKVRQKHEEDVKYQADATQSDASNEMVERELDAIMANAIDALPTQCRQVFRLSRFENLTYAEIAQQLGISVKTVENHMVKALRVLREKLKDYLPVIIWLLLMKN
jgi:RNA polymerase sigma-70 factor (ECF subfamily)